MKTLETRIIHFFEGLLPQEQPKQVKENVITDYLIKRYNRIQRLREIARKEAADNAKAGHPYNSYNYHRANFLLNEVTKQLNERPIFQNRFNLN